jgi:hypothetical protein
MKRHRVLHFDFDTRASILGMEVLPEWEPHVQESWRASQRAMREGLEAQYGSFAGQAKLQNFVDLGPAPFSILAFHNLFFRQAREAFVVGGYYPALTGICALGERVLNHLVRVLRDDFQATPQYKKVYSKSSFDNWELAIGTLASWGVLSELSAQLFRQLRDVRNRGVHFTPEVDRQSREHALAAIHLFREIIEEQFTAFGGTRWYITSIPGASFVRKDVESQPFVRRVILPNTVRVGPRHRLEHDGSGGLQVIDAPSYEEREIDDSEFARLHAEHQAAGAG